MLQGQAGIHVYPKHTRSKDNGSKINQSHSQSLTGKHVWYFPQETKERYTCDDPLTLEGKGVQDSRNQRGFHTKADNSFPLPFLFLICAFHLVESIDNKQATKSVDFGEKEGKNQLTCLATSIQGKNSGCGGLHCLVFLFSGKSYCPPFCHLSP